MTNNIIGNVQAGKPGQERLSGMTLIEVIIGMAVLVSGILASAAVLASTISLSQYSKEYDLAKAAANNKLEEMNACDFNIVYNTYHNTYFTVPGLAAPASQPAGAGYITVDNTNPELLDLTITITWRSGASPADLTFSMKTMRVPATQGR